MKRSCIIVFALLMSVSVAGAALKKGPYLQRVTQEGITITWQTSSSSAGYVEVHGGASVVMVDSGAKGTLHSTVINGLKKAKDYTYKIFVDGKDSGEGGSFRTAVGPDKAYRFLVYGDNRTQHTQHKKVIAAMMKEQDIAFVLNTGDMVSSGNNESHWQTFFEIETKMLRHWAFFGAVGNHEEYKGHANNFVKYFSLPPGGSDTYYSFRHGNAQFIVVDGHVEIDNPVVCFISQQIAEDCFNEKLMA
ncbi:MAG TPA: metallophosphoesterase family protein, partial [Myxococcales bacterium]|nr:metallophosphoesterase family protein [Myxococcales bacterium]